MSLVFARVALALTLLVGTNGALLGWLAFELHHDEIAKHHCENRHDPDSDCDGSCVLAKRMRASMDAHHSHDHDGSSEPKAVLSVPTLVAVSVSVAEVPSDPWREAPPSAPTRAGPPSDGALADVFRPPRGEAVSPSVLASV